MIVVSTINLSLSYLDNVHYWEEYGISKNSRSKLGVFIKDLSSWSLSQIKLVHVTLYEFSTY